MATTTMEGGSSEQFEAQDTDTEIRRAKRNNICILSVLNVSWLIALAVILWSTNWRRILVLYTSLRVLISWLG
jgi:hypothetical protein